MHPHPVTSYVEEDFYTNVRDEHRKSREAVEKVHLQVHWPVGQAQEVPQLHEQPGPRGGKD